MHDPVAKEHRSFIRLACRVAGAYVAKNSINAADLPQMITGVHGALRKLGTGAQAEKILAQKPAVPIRKSLTPDFLICLECGTKLRTLKRHLIRYGLTPAAYRDKWQLPSDYPMVAPSYTAMRSNLAKNFGLGRRPRPSHLRPMPEKLQAG